MNWDTETVEARRLWRATFGVKYLLVGLSEVDSDLSETRESRRSYSET